MEKNKMDKDYTILEVQVRDPWNSSYGMMNAYALKLEGEDGWISINQVQKTAEPKPGDVIFGHLEDAKTKAGKPYFKFKKARKDGGIFGNHAPAVDNKKIDYIVMMLEELTLRRESPENPVPMEDTLPKDEDGDKPLDLSSIPF